MTQEPSDGPRADWILAGMIHLSDGRIVGQDGEGSHVEITPRKNGVYLYCQTPSEDMFDDGTTISGWYEDEDTAREAARVYLTKRLGT